jgi:hypothetical protein
MEMIRTKTRGESQDSRQSTGPCDQPPTKTSPPSPALALATMNCESGECTHDTSPATLHSESPMPHCHANTQTRRYNTIRKWCTVYVCRMSHQVSWCVCLAAVAQRRKTHTSSVTPYHIISHSQSITSYHSGHQQAPTLPSHPFFKVKECVLHASKHSP